MTTDTLLRNADIQTLTSALRDRHARRWDVVLPSADLALDNNGRLFVPAGTVQIDFDGVTSGAGAFDLTSVAVENLSARCGIPIAYLRRMLNDAQPLAAQNVNHWLDADNRSVMVRTLLGASGEGGVARAILSDRFAIMDDLDVVMSALEGLTEALGGEQIVVSGCDLTERRMYVRVTSPTIARAVPALVERYRDPRSNRLGRDFPMISAGFVLKNSEVGEGAFNLVPQVVFQVCTNGMTRTEDAMRKVHVGGKHDHGTITWAGDTEEASLTLVKKQTRDAARHFLSFEYLDSVIAVLEGFAEQTITTETARPVVRTVTKALRYDEKRQDAVLAAFMTGGDYSPLGVAQAVSNVAIDVKDGDDAADLQADTFRVMEMAASAA